MREGLFDLDVDDVCEVATEVKERRMKKRIHRRDTEDAEFTQRNPISSLRPSALSASLR
jgi:hypothetical protein